MAWNVVIAGGGFGGAAAARELERVMPRQSARLVLVNETNFMLYTPFLPEAAAGTLEPRHVVTPLRDILKRTYLRLGSIVAHDPAAKTVQLRAKYGAVETLPYDQLLLALGSVSRTLPVPGLAEHAIGFKGLADAIWLRNHVIETLEEANATEDPATRDKLLTYVFVGEATPASRRSPSSRTSPPTRWIATREPACTGCAGSWAMHGTSPRSS